MIRSVLRIARWEATSGVSGLNRRTITATVLVVVAIGAVIPIAASTGASPDTGLYRVGVDETSPYYPPIASEGVFTIVAPDPDAFKAGALDILVDDTRIYVQDTRKGRAAATELTAAIDRYNDRVMRVESDQAAAFPVRVHLEYVERDFELVFRRGSEDTQQPDRQAGTPAEHGDNGETPANGFATPNDQTATTTPRGDAESLLPEASSVLLGRTTGTPSQLSPPFPFVSLVLAFAFIIPMNFVIQAYASSILHERGNRRGQLLLLVPVSKWGIIAGKTLPYFLAMMVIAFVTALAIGGGIVSLAAVAPIAVLFLACGFMAGLLARSHKELTFVLVTVSVIVTSYAFVPAVFTQVHPIAAISPLSLVVYELEGTPIRVGTYLFSTAPVLIAAGVLFTMGGALYREEDLFTQRRLPAKALDALAGPIRSPRSAAALSILSIPFVLLAELFFVAILFVLPLRIALPVLFVFVAIIEEGAKSIHVYAGFARNRYTPSVSTAGIVGAWSGLGFFFGEKAAVVVQLVGLTNLDLGRAAFELGTGTGGGSGALLAVLVVAPALLHAATAVITAVGATKGRKAYAVAFGGAVLVHTVYNLGVVGIVG